VYIRIRGSGEGDLFFIGQPPAAAYDIPMKNPATILCIFTALLFHPNAKAWSGAGHQVIAPEAYRQLSPDLRNPNRFIKGT
jgi:hypothetical protein